MKYTDQPDSTERRFAMIALHSLRSLRLFTAVLACSVMPAGVAGAQDWKLDPDDRIGSAEDPGETLRFKRISSLLEEGKITQK